MKLYIESLVQAVADLLVAGLFRVDRKWQSYERHR